MLLIEKDSSSHRISLVSPPPPAYPHKHSHWHHLVPAMATVYKLCLWPDVSVGLFIYAAHLSLHIHVGFLTREKVREATCKWNGCQFCESQWNWAPKIPGCVSKLAKKKSAAKLPKSAFCFECLVGIYLFRKWEKRKHFFPFVWSSLLTFCLKMNNFFISGFAAAVFLGLKRPTVGYGG